MADDLESVDTIPSATSLTCPTPPQPPPPPGAPLEHQTTVPVIMISRDDDDDKRKCCKLRARAFVVGVLSSAISVTTVVLSALLLLNFAVVDAELLLVRGLLIWDSIGIAVTLILVAGTCLERKVRVAVL